MTPNQHPLEIPEKARIVTLTTRFSKLGLFFRSNVQQLSIINHSSSDGQCSAAVGRGNLPPPTTCLTTSLSFINSKYGRFPSVKSSHASTPKDHTSLCSEYLPFSNASGARYRIGLASSSWTYRCLEVYPLTARPKLPTFTTFKGVRDVTGFVHSCQHQ